MIRVKSYENAEFKSKAGKAAKQKALQAKKQAKRRDKRAARKAKRRDKLAARQAKRRDKIRKYTQAARLARRKLRMVRRDGFSEKKIARLWETFYKARSAHMDLRAKRFANEIKAAKSVLKCLEKTKKLGPKQFKRFGKCRKLSKGYRAKNSIRKSKTLCGRFMRQEAEATAKIEKLLPSIRAILAGTLSTAHIDTAELPAPPG
jgi:hypothetical protein